MYSFRYIFPFFLLIVNLSNYFKLELKSINTSKNKNLKYYTKSELIALLESKRIEEF